MRITMPKNRASSGTKGGRGRTGQAEVEGVGAQFDIVGPVRLAEFPEADAGKRAGLVPEGKEALAGQIGDIDKPTLAIVKLQPEVKTGAAFDVL